MTFCGKPSGVLMPVPVAVLAERDLRDAGERGAHALDAEAHLARVARELLAERDRGRVHEVRAAGLDEPLPRLGLRLEGLREVLERGDQLGEESARDGDVHRGGEDVVRRLRCVDVVVRVHGLAERRRGEGREDLVHVHVRARAGARLVHVDGEVLVVGSARHLVRGRDDGLGDVGVHDAHLAVHDRGGALDAGERLDLRGLEPAAGDGEVLDGALRLGGVQRGPRDPHLAHRVVLDAERVRAVRLGSGGSVDHAVSLSFGTGDAPDLRGPECAGQRGRLL
jgi:hypothetical protein